MNKKVKMTIGLGGPSIIMIAVMLCLTTLASLSLLTAKHDWQLTEKTAEFEQAYYKAHCKAEEWLSDVDTLVQLGQQPRSLIFQAPVTDRQNLVVTIAMNGNTYHVVSEQLVTNEVWNYEEFEPQFNDQLVE